MLKTFKDMHYFFQGKLLILIKIIFYWFDPDEFSFFFFFALTSFILHVTEIKFKNWTFDVFSSIPNMV